MANPSKVKGNSFEREIVNKAREYGLEAKRAYASNGLSLGYDEDVDGVIEGIPFQAKRRKKIASYLLPEGSAEVQIIRADRGEAHVVITLDYFLELIRTIDLFEESIKESII